MTPSLPCPNCLRVNDLETVSPLGILGDKVILWNCQCGSTRSVEINHLTPQELLRNAIVADEMIYRFKRSYGFGKTG